MRRGVRREHPGPGEGALDDPALLDHLRRSLVEALRINNPKWIGDGDPEPPR